MKKIYVVSIIDDMVGTINALGTYSKNDSMFVVEYASGDSASRENTKITVCDYSASIDRTAEIKSTLSFVKNKSIDNVISTEYGDFDISVCASEVKVIENENDFTIVLKYNLLQNSVEFSRCAIKVVVEK